MKMDSKLMRGLAAFALVALVAAPLSASAVPGMGGNRPAKANATPKVKAKGRTPAFMAGKQKALHDRIAMVLEKRGHGFDAAASRIGSKIERVAAQAATVATAGGDVSSVLTQLEAARTSLAAARAAEATAVELFKAVPTATDKRAAFNAAKAQAKAARVDLTNARTQLRNAILTLKVVINGLEPVTP